MFSRTEKVPLQTLANISAGQSSPQDEDFCDSGIPFIKAGNLEGLKNGSILEENCNLVNDEIVRKYKLKKQKAGSVLVAKSGMSCNSGHIYTLKRDCYVVSHLAIISPFEPLYTDYIKWHFIVNGIKSLIQDTSYPSIQLGQFATMPIAQPSAEELKKFISIAQQADKSKFTRVQIPIYRDVLAAVEYR